MPAHTTHPGWHVDLGSRGTCGVAVAVRAIRGTLGSTCAPMCTVSGITPPHCIWKTERGSNRVQQLLLWSAPPHLGKHVAELPICRPDACTRDRSQTQTHAAFPRTSAAILPKTDAFLCAIAARSGNPHSISDRPTVFQSVCIPEVVPPLRHTVRLVHGDQPYPALCVPRNSKSRHQLIQNK